MGDWRGGDKKIQTHGDRISVNAISDNDLFRPFRALRARGYVVQGLRPWLSHFAPLGLTANCGAELRFARFHLAPERERK